MGIFSSKKKHYVGTTIQRVAEEDQIVDPFMLAITESTLNNVDLVDNLLETSLQSLPIRANNFYNFVKNNAPGKMPTGEVVLDDRFADATEAVINQLHSGSTVTYAYTKFGPPNAYHEAWQLLASTHNMNLDTGVLTALTSTYIECKVSSITLELPEAMRTSTIPWELENWVNQQPPSIMGYTDIFGQLVRSLPTNPVSFQAIASPVVRVHYRKKVTPVPKAHGVDWELESIVVTDEEFTFPLTRFGNDKEYFHVLYTVNGQRKFWTYEFGAGTYPSLDSVMNSSNPVQVMGQFYPNIYYRLNKSEQVDPIYAKMAKKLDMDFAKLSATINENPDIADVDSAIFNLGVPANSTSAIELRYLFDFFNNVWKKNRSGMWSANDWLGAIDSTSQASIFKTKNALYINDDVFKSALVYGRIAKKTYAGVIGPVGFAAGSSGTEMVSRTETDVDGNTVAGNYAVPFRAYRKQVASQLWEEVKVYDLTMVYTVFAQYKTTLGDADEELCLVPLDRSLVKTYAIRDQQELLNRSFNFIFNSHIVQKVKWYQTGLFKALLIVVAIVIFINTGAGAEFLAELAAATTTATAFATFLLNKVLVTFALQLGFKVFVKIAGPELAFIVAIVAMTMGMMKQNFALLNPTDLLKLAIGVFDGIGANLQDAFQDLQAEMDSFLSLKTDQEKALEAAENLLNPNVNPITPIILGESPTDFLYRTMVFGTSGFTQLNDVGSYTERSLQLPTAGFSINSL